MTVGFIGLGHVGGPMSARLLSAGIPLVVHDVSADALRRAVDAGAVAVSSPTAVAAEADLIFLSLPTPAIVENVVRGEGGLIAALRGGAVVVDMSTIDPQTTRALHGAVVAAGGNYLDAPISGGPPRAADGTLTIMVGGAGETFERVRPTLEHLGSQIVHVGGPGSGQMAKLCNNVMVSTLLAGLSECFLTGVKFGLDAEVLHAVIGGSSGGSWLLEHWVTPMWFGGDEEPRFTLDLLNKDVGLFEQTARELNVPTPVSASASSMLRAASNRGLGARDMAALVELYESLAGVRLLDNTPSARAPAGGPNKAPGRGAREAGR